MQTLNNIDLPTRKNEKWKYTNVSSFLDGRDFSNTNTTSADGGELIFKPIDEATTVLLKQMSSQLDDEYFYHLSNQENVFVTVIDKSFESPIMLSQNTSKNIHNVYIIKKSVSVNVFEEYSKNSSDTTFNITSSFFLEENANANFIQFSGSDDKKVIINNVRAYVSKNANFESIIASLGCKLVRNNINVKLTGENANTSVHGVYKLDGESHFDTNSYIEHASPRSYSHQLYKGIMDGRSHGVFTGLIKVNKDAQQINSNQLNKNLLLSKKAHCHSRPQLEIFADDVKCAHGSTTGQLSEEQLFYFMARGIPKDKARKMLASGFVNDVILKVKDLKLREYLTHKFHLEEEL